MGGCQALVGFLGLNISPNLVDPYEVGVAGIEVVVHKDSGNP